MNAHGAARADRTIETFFCIQREQPAQRAAVFYCFRARSRVEAASVAEAESSKPSTELWFLD
jgi:hypothetical protein